MKQNFYIVFILVLVLISSIICQSEKTAEKTIELNIDPNKIKLYNAIQFRECLIRLPSLSDDGKKILLLTTQQNYAQLAVALRTLKVSVFHEIVPCFSLLTGFN